MATKKRAKKRATHAAPARAAAAPARVTTLVNGQVTGEIGQEQYPTIQAAIEKLARDSGLKAFSVRVNGEVIKTPDAMKPLTHVKTLEVYAKDTRG